VAVPSPNPETPPFDPSECPADIEGWVDLDEATREAHFGAALAYIASGKVLPRCTAPAVYWLSRNHELRWSATVLVYDRMHDQNQNMHSALYDCVSSLAYGDRLSRHKVGLTQEPFGLFAFRVWRRRFAKTLGERASILNLDAHICLLG